MKEYYWYPSEFFSKDLSLVSKKYAIIILNQPLSLEYNKFLPLWKKAAIRICADGGANQLYMLYKDNPDILPDYIIGDMDSLAESTLEAYNSRGVKIIKINDQSSTDFGKSMDFIRSIDILVTDVIALNTFSGRVDQTLESINQIYLASSLSPPINLYLLSVCNITFLLFKGLNKVYLNQLILGPHCGLIPIGRRCTVTTEGMKWDLKDNVMEYGGTISTSNMVLKDIIMVETNEKILFTVEIRSSN
ncbi:thiamine pyrophosphokinase [Pneumocystis jirovecii RU7]|uniref:Thiamine pyrophosphokinase n=1 Tax=Pneumocystis jirovecii (strain RU7) TaxID=1408657 RepID=A0A0W4ZHG6_PNEJ7|nr:thiamine pyrophosphokinase [Pneumocystis jirovecii RU7]KTW27813.1 thiamine pyrophosphokinase [Pneumocystis jirovecii RU7]